MNHLTLEARRTITEKNGSEWIIRRFARCFAFESDLDKPRFTVRFDRDYSFYLARFKHKVILCLKPDKIVPVCFYQFVEGVDYSILKTTFDYCNNHDDWCEWIENPDFDIIVVDFDNSQVVSNQSRF